VASASCPALHQWECALYLPWQLPLDSWIVPRRVTATARTPSAMIGVKNTTPASAIPAATSVVVVVPVTLIVLITIHVSTIVPVLGRARMRIANRSAVVACVTKPATAIIPRIPAPAAFQARRPAAADLVAGAADLGVEVAPSRPAGRALEMVSFRREVSDSVSAWVICQVGILHPDYGYIVEHPTRASQHHTVCTLPLVKWRIATSATTATPTCLA